MPEEEAIERAREDEREGKSPSTQAGEFVREEMEHIREGQHGARSPEQGYSNWPLQSASSRSQVAASEARQGTNKTSGQARSHKRARRTPQKAFSKTLPRNETRA